MYIREAHPTDEWQVAANLVDGVEIAQTRSLPERQAAASACAAGLRLDIPILLDTMGDSAAVAFSAWPERLYVISRDGRVSYKGGKGPYGFDPTELETFLAVHTGRM